ncbi:MAG: nucleotide exchange factor GrpE [Patescibacteria group bacterium]|nr:nucleotide exchange factor GrpE [Patescibacteria group bacterium]
MPDSDEELIPEDEAEMGLALVKKLREKLKKAVEEKQEYLEGWQRARADFANFKREEAGFVQAKEERIRAEFAETIIPALDSFEMALKSPSFNNASQEWKSGITSVYNELKKSLEKFGIVSFSPLGEMFDPNRHEAVRQVEVGQADKEHTVVSVERSGYTLGDNIIRPAQVSVATFAKGKEI